MKHGVAVDDELASNDAAPQPLRGSHVRTALATIVTASAAPYGYTVALWSTGALLIHYHGIPRPGEVFLFIAGALLGFGIVGAAAHGALRTEEPLRIGQGHIVTGLLHWFAVGLAVGMVALIAPHTGVIAWTLGSFIATSLYLVGASLQLALATQRRSGGPSLPATGYGSRVR
ncbi:MAG: hypothetical protein M3401_14050 [Actinomycetota bacterium]|nr:hypothetical protein [Actinomycetota bacterium]